MMKILVLLSLLLFAACSYWAGESYGSNKPMHGYLMAIMGWATAMLLALTNINWE